MDAVWISTDVLYQTRLFEVRNTKQVRVERPFGTKCLRLSL